MIVSSKHFKIRDNTSVRLTITDNGNVGIGSNTPIQKLVIDGRIRIRGGSPGSEQQSISINNGHRRCNVLMEE